MNVDREILLSTMGRFRQRWMECRDGEIRRRIRSPFRASSRWVWPTERAARMIAVKSAVIRDTRENADALMLKSGESLAPFGDPLLLDSWVNRMFLGAREEDYSDWLAWILGKATLSELVSLFDLKLEWGKEFENDRPSNIGREMHVVKGHEGASGRLDLILLFPRNKAIVIEVKVTGVAGADTRKQEGYLDSLRKSGLDSTCILLVHDDTQAEVDRFDVFQWRDLCVNLRLWVSSGRCTEMHGGLFSASVLLFVGAVETCLLSLRWSFGLPGEEVEHHISRFLGGHG